MAASTHVFCVLFTHHVKPLQVYLYAAAAAAVVSVRLIKPWVLNAGC
jgi:hypothetical protein